ncbi:hypothetical protein WICPIJ_000031 [Wickerhamomyces pijperi]|uniref:Rhodanese domain-containing protein n=1 Tax=Wickerhamomyces pijperi TaxID=599730 RepID=A0A9P8QEJ6_WICPI|nr:hypothetical protein WICPIJ_000031 [Wickerhamomyces pijperi]
MTQQTEIPYSIILPSRLKEWLEPHLVNNPATSIPSNFIIIDVRGSDFKYGKIPTAINVPCKYFNKYAIAYLLQKYPVSHLGVDITSVLTWWISHGHNTVVMQRVDEIYTLVELFLWQLCGVQVVQFIALNVAQLMVDLSVNDTVSDGLRDNVFGRGFVVKVQLDTDVL